MNRSAISARCILPYLSVPANRTEAKCNRCDISGVEALKYKFPDLTNFICLQ